MEEEKQNFSRLMKDARRRFEEFLTNIDKNKPFLLRRMDRRSSKASVGLVKGEANRHLYRRMSCRSENSDEDLKIVKMRQVRSISKHKKIKSRFRHSVIGNGKEFSDFEDMLLIESSVYKACHDDDCGEEISAEDALVKYISQLYTNDMKAMKDNVYSTGDIKADKNLSVDKMLGTKLPNNKENNRKTTDNGKPMIRKSLSNEFQRVKTRKHRRASSYVVRSRLASPERSAYAADCVALTREQKRRVKEKMKQALKRPDNYSYLGNL